MTLTLDDARTFLAAYETADQAEQVTMLAQLAERIGARIDDLREVLSPQNDTEYKVRRLQLFETGDLTRSRAELVALLDNVLRGAASEAQVDEWLRLVARNVEAPFGFITDLIFYSEPQLTAEQILDRVLAYKPRVLHL